MAKYTPPTFNQAQVLSGLHKAMGFGEPNEASDKPTFEIPLPLPTTGAPRGDSGVPFDPSVRVQRQIREEQISCAYEFRSTGDENESYGSRATTRVEICIVGAEWQTVKDFTHVRIGGDRYLRTKTLNLALGSLDVVLVTAISEDER